jgi:hypothetical protein
VRGGGGQQRHRKTGLRGSRGRGKFVPYIHCMLFRHSLMCCQAPCLQFHSSCCWWLLSDADKAAHHASPPPTPHQHQRPSPHWLSHNPTSLYILPSYLPQALDNVQAQLDVLSGSCTAISSALATARVTASGLLGDADKAARQLAALDSKGQLVEEFLVKYQLTPEEVRGHVDVRTSSVIVCLLLPLLMPAVVAWCHSARRPRGYGVLAALSGVPCTWCRLDKWGRGELGAQAIMQFCREN